MTASKILQTIRGRPASDGAGVKLLRIFGGAGPERFDPFLMLDEFGSNEASDYIGGFPNHPHRGFETITYMLEGKMEHRDHMGNVGRLNDGDVQWMTAGSGVIHSEMPQQTAGRMRGFQLWLNLPAKTKMQPAQYRDIPASALPVVEFAGGRVIAIAGGGMLGGQTVNGYLDRPDTQPRLWDVHLDPDAEVEVSFPESLNILLYVYESDVFVGDDRLSAQHLARLGEQRSFTLRGASSSVVRLLVIAGKPLREPVVQYGPFVMNSEQEIQQAIDDYRAGVLTDGSSP